MIKLWEPVVETIFLWNELVLNRLILVEYLLPTRVFTGRSIVCGVVFGLVYNFHCRENVREKECGKTNY